MKNVINIGMIGKNAASDYTLSAFNQTKTLFLMIQGITPCKQ
jgi:hypothetical protein